MLVGRFQILRFIAISVFSLAVTSTLTNSESGARKACELLSERFPHLVAFPGSSQFILDISHWVLSSTQNASCSIEPQTPDQVREILQIIGRDDIRAPFAVKGGGHAYNRGFSSTSGVQISMARFDSVTYDPANKTATVGTGLNWDQVYKQLEPLRVMIAGGRVPGVGVGGLSLGGGYSWKSNQFGLTVDTIVAYDIVLPSGEIVHVTNDTQPDLFFALKGGLNAFGIVTSITYETHPQTLIFAGNIVYAQNVTDRVNSATATFDLTNTDPKAQAVVSYVLMTGQFLTAVDLFYDAPNIPPGTFDVFTDIPAVTRDLKTRTFVEFLNTTFGPNGPDANVPFVSAQSTIPIVRYTVPILEEMASQLALAGAALSAEFPGAVLGGLFSAEPFLHPFAHSRGGAYPHPPARQVTPAMPMLLLEVASASVPGPDARAALVRTVKRLSTRVQARAVAEGQSRWDDLLYPNYALADTPLELMYGANVARLDALADKFDPRGIMQLTGGFKFGSKKA